VRDTCDVDHALMVVRAVLEDYEDEFGK